MRKQPKTIIYEILEVSDSSNFYSFADDFIITFLIVLNIENSSELIKLCVETTKQKLGTAFKSEEILRDLAIHLDREISRKFEL